MNNKLKYFLHLGLTQRLGVKKLNALIDYFGSVEDICTSKENELIKVPGISRKIAKSIVEVSEEKIKKELDLIAKEDMGIVTVEDSKYPKNLSNIYSPPILLYFKGTIKEDDEHAVSIVGSRNATYYGLATAEKLAYKLANHGITIVSGMARGIDTAAHKGALKAGGRTIAVLGSGLMNIYPPENKKLFYNISNTGAVITEFPLKTAPYKQNFPKRNRIISGLSLGVIVVEAARRSGALITSDFALEQGREVFAVPGKINSVTSQGTHMLIKQGAKLVEKAEDVLEELNIEVNEDNNTNFNVNNLNQEEKTVFSFLKKEPQHIDKIAKKGNVPLSFLLSILMKLQIKGFVKEIPGKRFVKR